jgi:hypothetical protein
MTATESAAIGAVAGDSRRCRYRSGRWVERRVLLEDRPLESLQRTAGLDPELVDQSAASLLVARQRLRLAAATVERQHQLALQPLTERMLADQRVKLAHERCVLAEGEVGVDPILQRRQACLLEPRDRCLRERLVCKILKRRPAPERQRVA